MSVTMDRPQQQRPRSKSTFSFKSDNSHGSANTSSKHESKHLRQSSHELKPHLGPTTKADPNAAMNEVQPVAAALEKPTLQSLRSFQHTDVNGNPIAEPDLSNPTRSRWERPLDTIRSFEAAIDNEYRRRSQAVRGDFSEVGGYASQRNSYYGGGGYDQNRWSSAGSGYYGSRQAAAARESWAEGGYNPMGGPRTRYSRMQSDPGYNRHSNAYGVYPSQGYQQSRDTVNTGGSNGSESVPNSTDPNSENSSIERGGPVMPVTRPDLGEQYGFHGFGSGPQPILEDYATGTGPSNNGYFPQHNGANIPPPVPAKTGPPPPPPHNPNTIKLTNPQGQGQPPASGNRPNGLARKSTDASEKRRSWFKRRFSKEKN